jgi:FHA domain
LNKDNLQKGHVVTDAQPHVSVERGEGIIARYGDAVVLITDEGQYEERTEEVLSAVEAAAAKGDSSGAALATALGKIVVDNGAGEVPPFGVVARLEDAYLVLLHGAVWAEITGPDGPETVSGEQAVTWVDRKVEGELVSLSIGSSEGPIEVDPRSDLQAGLVPGSGFIFTPSGAPAPVAAAAVAPAAPVAAPVEEVKEEPKVVPEPIVSSARATMAPSAPLEEPGGNEEPEPEVADEAPAEPAEDPHPAIVVKDPEPEPVAAAPAPARPTADLTPVAAAAAAAVAEPLGARPEPPTPVDARPAPPVVQSDVRPAPPVQPEVRPEPPRPAPPAPAPVASSTLDLPAASEAVKPERPAAGATQMVSRPLGYLVGADGMRIPLDRTYALGRAPQEDPGVSSGAATPVKLDDSDNLISRVHSFVTVDGGKVMVRDSGSANGTFIAQPGAPEWTPVGQQPVELPPTWSMRVGKVIFTHVADTVGAS